MISIEYEMPWTSCSCIGCQVPECVEPQTCEQLDRWVKNIPISRPPLIEIHPPKPKLQPPKIEPLPQPLPPMIKEKVDRIDGKFLFSLIKDFLIKNPDSTRAQIYAGIQEFKKFKRPDSSLWNILTRYGEGQIISSKKKPFRLRLREPEPQEPIVQTRIPNLYTGNLSELIEIDCNGWNLK